MPTPLNPAAEHHSCPDRERARSFALVIDDSAFTAGIWFGADSAAGTLLAKEILRALAECRSQGTPAYFVRTRRESDIYTTDFEAASDVVFSDRSSMEEWTEDYTFGLLTFAGNFCQNEQGSAHWLALTPRGCAHDPPLRRRRPQHHRRIRRLACLHGRGVVTDGLRGLRTSQGPGHEDPAA